MDEAVEKCCFDDGERCAVLRGNKFCYMCKFRKTRRELIIGRRETIKKLAAKGLRPQEVNKRMTVVPITETPIVAEKATDGYTTESGTDNNE